MTTSSATEASSLSTFFRSILTWSEKIVGVTLIIYVAGFIVQNLHLGFLGVVNLDGIRVRYLLSGTLFISFIGSVLLPFYGLLHLLRDHWNTSLLKTFWGFMKYSFQVYVLLSTVVFGMQYLSGSNSRFIVSGQNVVKYQWTNFIVAAFMLYFLLALVLLIFFLIYKYFQHRIDKMLDKRKDGPIEKYGIWLYFFFFVAILASIYTLTVYPYIPQQIGGGSLLSVEVITSSAKLAEQVSNPLHDVYLVDRTSSGAIFMVVDKQTEAKRVLEVANSQIEFLMYK